MIRPIEAHEPDVNLAHFRPLLRNSGRATGQAALSIPTPLIMCHYRNNCSYDFDSLICNGNKAHCSTAVLYSTN